MEIVDGIRLFDEGEIVKEVEKYFKDIFSSSSHSPQELEAIVGLVDTWISRNMRERLEEPFSAEEVKTTLFSMGRYKAPGPNGFHAIVFQKHWDLVGGALTSVVLGILNDSKYVASFTEAHIVLIPKLKCPKKVSNFRPISLCNVIYKVVTKALANWLKTVLASTISMEQSAFVQGRLITDNILVAFEVLHTIHQKTGGGGGLMGLKLDIS